MTQHKGKEKQWKRCSRKTKQNRLKLQLQEIESAVWRGDMKVTEYYHYEKHGRRQSHSKMMYL